MKIIKSLFIWLFFLLVAVNAVIIISGKTYLYKAVANTYLKGRSGPSIDEFRIFPYNEVKAGQFQPWPESHNFNHLKLPDSTEEQIEDYETVAYLVIKNDSIVYEKYWDGFGEDAVSNSFSMAKTIVSILTGIAIDEGKLKSVDQSVSEILPQFMEGRGIDLKIKHLLTMSSGINFDENYGNPLAYPAAAYYGENLSDLTFKYEVAEQPGVKFNYLSGNTQVLGFMLENATGMSISEYASQKLWKPLGAKNDAYWSLDQKDGVEKAYCCFNSNARDFARIGQLYLDSGRWKGKQIVSQNYVLNSVVPAPLLDAGIRINKYGYSWWLMPHKKSPVFYARGILGQYIFVIPDKDMVIVRLGRKRDPEKINDHPKDVYLYLDAALSLIKK